MISNEKMNYAKNEESNLAKSCHNYELFTEVKVASVAYINLATKWWGKDPLQPTNTEVNCSHKKSEKI